MAGQPYKYKSVTRTLTPGLPYQDAAAVLDEWGAQGWELVGVQVTQAILNNVWFEVFYLKQPGALAEQKPGSE